MLWARRSDWKVFSGNELAALLGWWMFFNWRQRNPAATDCHRLHMLSTCVSSCILRTMAQQEGFSFQVGPYIHGMYMSSYSEGLMAANTDATDVSHGTISEGYDGWWLP